MDAKTKYRKGLSSIYTPLYDALCEELPKEWRPYSGWRSFTEQDALWMQGRVLPGKIVTNAKSGESPHNFGMASDWTVWDDEGKPYWPRASSSVWDTYRKAVSKVGGHWGGTWADCPHNEVAIVPPWKWKECKEHWDAGGLEAVEKFIRSIMK